MHHSGYTQPTVAQCSCPPSCPPPPSALLQGADRGCPSYYPLVSPPCIAAGRGLTPAAPPTTPSYGGHVPPSALLRGGHLGCPSYLPASNPPSPASADGGAPNSALTSAELCTTFPCSSVFHLFHTSPIPSLTHSTPFHTWTCSFPYKPSPAALLHIHLRDVGHPRQRMHHGRGFREG